MARYSATVLTFTLVIVIKFMFTTQSGEFWNSTVVYQIYVRSFMDSDGDGVGDLDDASNGLFGADEQTWMIYGSYTSQQQKKNVKLQKVTRIVEKLPYLHMLGVGAILLSPIFRSPMEEEGYDVSHFTVVDPLYGGNEAFDRLLMKAKEHDLRLLLDFIPNHSSEKHYWFQKSIQRVKPYTDFYVWRNGRSQNEPPNNWLSRHGGSAWEWHPGRRQYYLHTYSAKQPDFNFRIRNVARAIEYAMKFWLNKGVDGFRMLGVANLFENDDFLDEPVKSRQEYSISNYDSLAHVFTSDVKETLDMVHQWRQFMDHYTLIAGGSTRLLIADVKSDWNHVLSYYGDDTAPGALPVNPLFLKYLGKWSSALDFSYSVSKWHSSMAEGCYDNWMLGNPDVSRVATRFGMGRVDLLHMVILLLPGLAFTYYGEELGMMDIDLNMGRSEDAWQEDEEQNMTRNLARAPFQWDSTTSAGFSTKKPPWLPVHPNYIVNNLYSQQRDPRSHYNLYWRLVATRKEPAIAKGTLTISAFSPDVLSFMRNYRDHDTFVVVINFGEDTTVFNVRKHHQLEKSVRVHLATKNFNLKVGETLNPEKLELPPQSGVVLTTGTVKDYAYSRAGALVQLSSAMLLALGVTLPVLYSLYD